MVAAAVHPWRETRNANKVSREDVAAEAGVSPATICSNFGTRDWRLEEMVKHLTNEMLNKQWVVVKSDLLFPLKVQSVFSGKMATLQDRQIKLLDKFSTDSVVRQYLDGVYEAEMKPMMTAIIGEGKQQGYVNRDLPDDTVVLYLNTVQAGGTAYGGDPRRIAGDSRVMAPLMRLFCCGLFQKEFDLTVDFDKNKEAT